MNVIGRANQKFRVSLAPGFSRVCRDTSSLEPFQRLLAPEKPLKRLMSLLNANTRLKPGANERCRVQEFSRSLTTFANPATTRLP